MNGRTRPHGHEDQDLRVSRIPSLLFTSGASISTSPTLARSLSVGLNDPHEMHSVFPGKPQLALQAVDNAFWNGVRIVVCNRNSALNATACLSSHVFRLMSQVAISSSSAGRMIFCRPYPSTIQMPLKPSL